MIEEAKLVGPGGMALSIGTAFIENTEVPARGGRDAEAWKQDCEVTALRRLLPALKGACPQTPICLTGDALYACRPIIELVEVLKQPPDVLSRDPDSGVLDADEDLLGPGRHKAADHASVG